MCIRDSIWIIPAYGIFYMISFMLVEKISTETHLIHSFVDDLIPFCEYFIIPYVLWFLVVLGSVMYFALGSPGKKEYYQYLSLIHIWQEAPVWTSISAPAEYPFLYRAGGRPSVPT